MRVGRRAPRGTHGAPDPEPAEIVVFPTGRTLARAEPAPVDPTPDRTDRPAHAPEPEVLRSDVTGADGTTPAPAAGTRRYHARPGHRPGREPVAVSHRTGGDTDIVRSLRVAPATASRIVVTGAVFELPLPHLRIDPEHGDERFLVWAAHVVGDGASPVPVTLHLHGSPSMVVTVLELVPCRRVRWGRERFVRFGVEAIEELAHRIERAA